MPAARNFIQTSNSAIHFPFFHCIPARGFSAPCLCADCLRTCLSSLKFSSHTKMRINVYPTPNNTHAHTHNIKTLVTTPEFISYMNHIRNMISRSFLLSILHPHLKLQSQCLRFHMTHSVCSACGQGLPSIRLLLKMQYPPVCSSHILTQLR